MKNLIEEEQVLQVHLTLEREMYYNEDGNYGICSVGIAKNDLDYQKIKLSKYGSFTIKGSMPKLEHGKRYKAKLIEKEDKKYGLGYNVVSIYEDAPISKDEQMSFLSSILTPKQTEEIFKAYPDDDILDLIKNDKFDISKVHGIGEVIFEKIKKKIEENMEYREAIIKLSDLYGVTHNMIKKLSDHYGSPTLLVQKVEENPYILSYEVNGIGFKKCDSIALGIGIDKNSPKRIEACLLFILDREENQGHVWVSKNKLISEIAKETEIRMNVVSEFFDNILENESKVLKKITILGDKIATKSNYEAEKSIASHIERLLSIENNYHITNVDGLIYQAEQEQGFEYTEEQVEAIKLAVSKNVIIINGKAGTGKTSVLKGVIKVLSSQEGLKYATCALSGKASQRIQQSTNLPSSTMHRLLGYNPNTGFSYDEGNPLEQDVVVLDEASMVNSYLMDKLVCAIKDGAKLIILGDTAQLEPIGAGNCLLDLINSGSVPRVELTIVHRQAQKSGILSVANTVREGKQFCSKTDYKSRRLGELKDLWFYPYAEQESVVNQVIKLSKKYAEAKTSILDFQVIVPMKERGKLSTFEINKELQDIFNPDELGKGKIVRGKVEFRQGDKVIQNGNNYELGVFNGTLGIIEYVDNATKTLVINFEDVGRVEYKGVEALKEIDLAYALTVHRTQGSQWKFVLFAIDYSSYVLLSRQLVYTALTRASNTCFLVTELNALTHAVRTDKSIKRNTFLEQMLK